MSTYHPGSEFYASFATHNAGTGNVADADATPTAALRRNGVDSVETVTITKNATGDYTASGTIPTAWSAGDDLELVVAATVDGVSAKLVIPLGVLQAPLRLDAAVAAVDTATSFTASADLEATADAYVDMAIVFTSGANKGIPRRITAYTAGRVVTVDAAFPFTIAEGDAIALIGYTG